MSEFSYYRAIGIGIGDLGNNTLAQMRQILPQSAGVVTLRGFHHAPVPDTEGIYSLNLPDGMYHSNTRADIREHYLWHLENRRSALMTHLSSAMADVQGGVLVYLFVDLQDPTSALLLDIFHLVAYLLRTRADNPSVRWLIFVAFPHKQALDAGQFATLREWLRFTHGDVAQNLFPKESPFAYLNADHPVLFNRLLAYLPHPHLSHLWAEICLAQLQSTPANTVHEDIYSHQFFEYQVSNFSSRSQGILINDTRSSAQHLLLCSAFSAYSVALPMVYLHRQWSADYITHFLTHYLGKTSNTQAYHTLQEWLSWHDIPPILHFVLTQKSMPMMQTDAQVRAMFFASSIPVSDALMWTLPQSDWKQDDTVTFTKKYQQLSAPIIGECYIADYPSGVYGRALASVGAQILDTAEERLTAQIMTILNYPITAKKEVEGGLALILATLMQLNQTVTTILNALKQDLAMVINLMQTRKQIYHLVVEQLTMRGHLTRLGRLLPQAETFLHNQTDDIAQKKYYLTLAFAVEVLEGILKLSTDLLAQLHQWQATLLTLHTYLENAQKSSIRPINTAFCWWIHDPAWEKSRNDHLLRTHIASWHHQMGWEWNKKAVHLTLMGNPLTPNDNPQESHLPHWLALINLESISTNLWEIYAQDEAQGIHLFTQLYQLIKGTYHPLPKHSADTTHLLSPLASPHHLGEKAFMRHMQDTLSPQLLRHPSGERITYLIGYEEQPLQDLPEYLQLYDKYSHFLNISAHHLFMPERAVVVYEAYHQWQLLSAPVVALFEYESRLQLWVLLGALDFWCEIPLDDTARYLGVLVNGSCLPLTKPSEFPSWYDATYQFVWYATTHNDPPRPLHESALMTWCDATIAQRTATTSLEAGQGKEWDQIRSLFRFRKGDNQPILRIGVLLDLYSAYLERCNYHHAHAQTPILADLYRAFMLITQAQIDHLKDELRSYRP